MNVKSLKLSNGQEVVTRLDESEDKYILSKPVILSFSPQGLGFLPFMFSSNKEEFEIDKSRVDVVTDTSKQVEDQYLEATSGISLSASEPLLKV